MSLLPLKQSKPWHGDCAVTVLQETDLGSKPWHGDRAVTILQTNLVWCAGSISVFGYWFCGSSYYLGHTDFLSDVLKINCSSFLILHPWPVSFDAVSMAYMSGLPSCFSVMTSLCGQDTLCFLL